MDSPVRTFRCYIVEFQTDIGPPQTGPKTAKTETTNPTFGDHVFCCKVKIQPLMPVNSDIQ